MHDGGKPGAPAGGAPGEAAEWPDARVAQAALDQAPDTAFWIGADARFVYVNPAACRSLGYTRDELLRLTVHDVDPDTPRERWEEHWARARERGTYVIETRHRTKDGRLYPVEVRGVHLALDGRELHCSSAADITERRRAEAALRENEERLRLALEAAQRSLAEKEVLLREVHHRVKNNLQVVSSLLSMQARHADGASRTTFEEAQARIRSMALVHELLHRSRDLARVDLPSYLDAVVRGIEGTHAAEGDRIEVLRELQPAEVTAELAVPCGLLVNELISNAYRHAFPGGRRGRVRLALRREPDGTLELSVADDGVGLPAGADAGRSLGLRLVHLLAERQLDGTLRVEREGGTCFTVRFGPAAAS